MNPSIGELPGPGEKVWYVIHDQGHIGPLSFQELVKSKVPATTRIWARGWPVPLAFEVIRTAYRTNASPGAPLSLPPLPEAEVAPPPVPRASAAGERRVEIEVLPKSRRSSRWKALLVLPLFVAGGGVWWFTRPPKLLRPEGLPLPAYRDIRAGFRQSAVPMPVRKLGMATDFTRLWLADRSRQTCSYDIALSSAPDKNLSGEKAAFQSEATLEDHWVEFSKWTFTAGQKLWPGIYQLSLHRIECRPEGLRALWERTDPDLSIAFEVEIFTGQRKDLLSALAELAKRKRRDQHLAREALVSSWRDVEEKCRTLSAISLQIQQGFETLLDKKVPWNNRLKAAVERYTLRFGGFLTDFTIRNEEDFNRIGTQEVLDKVTLMEKGPVITNFAKRIGFVSMELIEWVQKGTPKRPDLEAHLRTLSAELEKVRVGLEDEANLAQAHYRTNIKKK